MRVCGSVVVIEARPAIQQVVTTTHVAAILPLTAESYHGPSHVCDRMRLRVALAPHPDDENEQDCREEDGRDRHRVEAQLPVGNTPNREMSAGGWSLEDASGEV